MAGTAATLVLKIVADAKDAQKGLQETSKGTDKFKKGLGTASKFAAGALAAVGLAAIDAGKAAAEDAQGQAVLAKTMQNTTGASKAQIASTEDWISSMAAATGVADDQLRPALGDLMRATGDVAKSQDALKVAMDVSAATGKPLQAVTKAMAKGFGGSTGALGKLVPGMDKAALKAGDMTAIMAELAKKTGGAAAAAADTAAGKMQRAQLAMDEAKESIGAGLLPIMGKLADMFGTVGKFAQDNPKLFQAIAIAVAAVAAAILLLNLAVTVYQGVMVIAGAISGAAWAAALWPILLVIAAVALVVVGIVLLWKKCEGFRTVVLAVWGAIKTGAEAAAKVVVAVFKVAWLLVSSYVKAYLFVIQLVFNAIRTAVSAVARAVTAAWGTAFSAIKSAVRTISGAFAAVWSAVKTAVSGVARWISDLWSREVAGWKRIFSGVKSALTAPFDAVKSAVQGVIDLVDRLIDKLRNIKIPKISLPKIPGLSSSASSGAATRGAPTGLSARAGVGASAASSGTGGLVINLYGVLDGPDAARKIRAVLRDDDRRRSGIVVSGSR